MSEVLVDTIKGKATASNITIGSTPLVSASANSLTVRGEGSAQTSIQQGLAKAWATYTSVSWAIGDSLNCSSASDNNTGDFTTNFSNNFGSINIVSAGTSIYGVYFSYYEGSGNSHTTSSVRYYGLTGAGANSDMNYSYGSNSGWAYHGDLA
tara:strand:+ start:804 stop:1259 length:456 start_codon:yes stop_codon:yes gene_type:complete